MHTECTSRRSLDAHLDDLWQRLLALPLRSRARPALVAEIRRIEDALFHLEEA